MWNRLLRLDFDPDLINLSPDPKSCLAKNPPSLSHNHTDGIGKKSRLKQGVTDSLG